MADVGDEARPGTGLRGGQPDERGGSGGIQGRPEGAGPTGIRLTSAVERAIKKYPHLARFERTDAPLQGVAIPPIRRLTNGDPSNPFPMADILSLADIDAAGPAVPREDRAHQSNPREVPARPEGAHRADWPAARPAAGSRSAAEKSRRERSAEAPQYPIGDTGNWTKIVANVAAIVDELELTFVAEIEAAVGPAPEWFEPGT